MGQVGMWKRACWAQDWCFGVGVLGFVGQVGVGGKEEGNPF